MSMAEGDTVKDDRHPRYGDGRPVLIGDEAIGECFKGRVKGAVVAIHERSVDLVTGKDGSGYDSVQQVGSPFARERASAPFDRAASDSDHPPTDRALRPESPWTADNRTSVNLAGRSRP